MAQELKGRKIAALVENGFEAVELTQPKAALEAAGATVHVVSPQRHHVKSWKHTDWGEETPVDRWLDAASPDDYDALLLPGGVISPDKLRINEKAVQFVRAFVTEGKPIAAICHGPWTLIDADAVEGRKMTSWPSLRCDLRNAGALWVDQEVVVDNGLVTSRKPDDIPAFNVRMVEEFAEGRHVPAGASRTTSSRR